MTILEDVAAITHAATKKQKNLDLKFQTEIYIYKINLINTYFWKKTIADLKVVFSLQQRFLFLFNNLTFF